VQFLDKLNDPEHMPLTVVGYYFNVSNPVRGNPPMSKFGAFLKNESGATAIEYGLIAAGISVAIIAAVNGLGTQLNNVFSTISTDLAAQ
jgi:pilus assembly protein Flp/PilA